MKRNGAVAAAEWAVRAITWSNTNPPPVGAPSGSRTPRTQAELQQWTAWTRSLHDAGLAVLHWPARWGGADADPAAMREVTRVLRRAGQPLPLTDVSIHLVAPTIMRLGSPRQQEQHLPLIAAGAAVWTQLFSEPDSGSDLAALRTRAERSPTGGWIVNGQKVWNTYAHVAQWGYLLARTGAPDGRHRGLSMFLVPMDSPGIKVVPIKEITGDADFNEVFFNDVHLSDEALLGQVDEGWAIGMGTLDDERRVVGNLVIGLQAEAERLAAVLARLGASADGGDVARFAVLQSGIDGLAQLAASDHGFGKDFDSAGKILFSELNLDLGRLCLDVAARHPSCVPPGWARRWSDNYAYARGYTISGGANELLRGVLAHRGLGLPRS